MKTIQNFINEEFNQNAAFKNALGSIEVTPSGITNES
jgi:hypothetical protein